jgi:hypothetical protein
MSETQEKSDIDRRREEAQWKVGLDQVEIQRGLTPAYILGEADFHLRVKRAAVQDLKECRWSREQVALGLTKLIGREVSLAQIDSILAETKLHRLPAEWLPAWVRVTGSKRLLELLCAECGMYLADVTEHDLAGLAREQLQLEKVSSKIDMLRKRLAEQV